MRYIRFLKTPRIVDETDAANVHVHALITITSDLGDSFLPCDIVLSAELWSDRNAKAIPDLHKTVKWSSSMRSLPISFPLARRSIVWPARIRVGVEPNAKIDRLDLFRICAIENPAVVSACSAAINPPKGTKEAPKRIERRFLSLTASPISIWEETGESIARHLWDAGLSTCIYMDQIISLPSEHEWSPNALYSGSGKGVQVIELGTGCGMVGIALAQAVPNASVILTDLPEAEEIAKLNITQNFPVTSSQIEFQILEWGKPLSSSIKSRGFDLVIASDCTYNPDSSPKLVQTITQLVLRSPKAAIIVAMKVRHSSEDVFFALMTEAGFIAESKRAFPLCGDDPTSPDIVDVFLFHAHDLSSTSSFAEKHGE